MHSYAVNHVTVARMPFEGLLDLAAEIGAVGVELRCDLPGELFDGLPPAKAGDMARKHGLRILALSEVKMFNDWSDARAAEARALMQTAAACGAEAVSLIPCNDGTSPGHAEIGIALRELKPLLEEFNLIGLVEPLGFETSSLRHKATAVEAIEALGAGDRFRIVHDTFHHALAGGGPVFPRHTGIVHISGVTEPGIGFRGMRDDHRVLVDRGDRLNNLRQIDDLLATGYTGPFSFEAFSPDIHNLTDPGSALLRSIQFIDSQLNSVAA